MLSAHGIPCVRLVGAPGLLQHASTPEKAPPLGLTEGVAAMAEAATVAVAAATAAKMMAVQWKRWIRTGATWAVQVAGYTPRNEDEESKEQILETAAAE